MIGEVTFEVLLGDLYGRLTEPERLPLSLKRLGDVTGCHIGGFLRQNLRSPELATEHVIGVSVKKAEGYVVVRERHL